MSPTQCLALCLASLLAGIVNSVAGGGTLLTFPTLFAVLGNAESAGIIANATSTVALFPGSLASAWGYRKELTANQRWLRIFFWPSILGGTIGSLLVVCLPGKVFAVLVPWLILTATLLFLLQPVIARWTGMGQPHSVPTRLGLLGVITLQFVTSVYGGYFGAGIGILMLSSLALSGLNDIHEMNALKTILASLINGTSVIIFVLNGAIRWDLAVPMIVSATLGGYVGARIARRLNRTVVRGTVIAIGLILATHYFLSPR